MKKFKCKICGYIVECEKLEEDYKCPICGVLKEQVEEQIIADVLNEDIEAIIDAYIENKEHVSQIINVSQEDKRIKIDEYNPGVARINEKCINCGLCKKTCEEQMNISYDLNICKNPICLSCGQCIVNCPAGALIPKYNYREVKKIIDANEKIVVALTSPAVRVAIGETFGEEPGTNCEGKLVTALKKLGFDYVFDTTYGADITILEEATELAKKIVSKKNLPQFTSCCPGWVKYAEIYHPELLENLSTCKSPIGMQTALIKSYFCEKMGFDSNKIVTVAITPCTAKKMEAKEYSLNIDFVLTTSELSLLIKEENIKFEHLNETPYDPIMEKGSGGGVIFGNSGGVMESAIRTLYKILTKNDPKGELLTLSEVRGLNGIKDAQININGLIINVAVVNGLKNLDLLLKNDRYKKYHFIEVMSCPGGCIAGGGQPLTPISKLDEVRSKRIEGLYKIDKKCKKRCAHNNTDVKITYKEYLGKPLSEKSKKILHTSYCDKSNLLNKN